MAVNPTAERRPNIFEIPGLKTLIVSYPKTGRTWVRMLLGKAICARHGLDEALIFKPLELSRAAGIPRLIFTHDRAVPVEETGFEAFNPDKSPYRGKRVVFLLRDPRDVAVSLYFHLTKRAPRFHGTLSEFVRDERFGVASSMRFYRAWHESRNIPQTFLPIRYEEMVADSAGALRSILGCVGAEGIDDAIVARVAEACAFENMRSLEREGKMGHPKLLPGDVADEESYKVRRGKIGGYVDYLSPEDIAYADGVIAEMASPLYPYA